MSNKILTYYDNGDGKVRLHKLTKQEKDNTLSYIEAPNGKRLKFKHEQILIKLGISSLLYCNNYFSGKSCKDNIVITSELKLYRKLCKKFKLKKQNKYV